MKRYVEHFNINGRESLEEQINSYAKFYNVEIITISAMSGNGIYVLFEEKEEEDDDR